MPRLVKPSAKKKASPRGGASHGGAPRGGDARRSLKRTIGMEIAALQKLQSSLASLASSAKLEAILQILARTEGRVIISGMGKSGHVARKVAATFASTGTPAQFVHPSEASHGDLGMITKKDAILVFSWSGETEELANLLTYSRRFKIPLILITSRRSSTLAQHADITLLLPKVEEACPIGLAPTSSVILQMALGDALAIALLEKSGFTSKHFKDLHPGGALGAGLQSVSDIMHTGAQIPLCPQKRLMSDVLIDMSQKGFGCIGVQNARGALVGIITDGDLRRNMKDNILKKYAADIMTQSPKTIAPHNLAASALAIMNKAEITSLFVLKNKKPVGFLHIHDFLRHGIV